MNRFTRREAQVLAGLHQGKQNKTIGYELGMAPSTVKIHVQRIFIKTKTHNRTAAVIATLSLMPRPVDVLREILSLASGPLSCEFEGET